MKLLFSTIALIFIFTGCSGFQSSSDTEVWTSFIFPNKDNTKRNMQQGAFPTLQMCQEASDASLLKINALEIGFSECGLNCSFHEGMNSTICERVVTRK